MPLQRRLGMHPNGRANPHNAFGDTWKISVLNIFIFLQDLASRVLILGGVHHQPPHPCGKTPGWR
eukprot:6678844-Pyramimonas_sp.AAC.1